jgi:hypothetical protein
MPRTNQQGIEMTEPQGGSMRPHYLELFDHLIAAPNDHARSEILARNKAERAHLPRQWPTMPPFNNAPRESMMELRPRHLLMVEEHGHQKHGYNRKALGDYFLQNYNRLFGTIRKSKAREVPSDQFRKELIIHRLLDLIELRREEYKNERAGLPRHHHIES